MTQLLLNLSDDMLKQLEIEAQQRQIPIEDVVKTALDYFFVDREPTNEEILSDLRESLKDTKAGRVRQADDVFTELYQELGFDADDSDTL